MPDRKLNSTNFHNQSFLEDKCPLNKLIHLLSKRWMTEVLFSIEEGKSRFNTLKDDLEHISDHILADRLRLLEHFQLIEKSCTSANAAKVEYNLTKNGMELSNLLDQLCQFAEVTMDIPKSDPK